MGSDPIWSKVRRDYTFSLLGLSWPRGLVLDSSTHKEAHKSSLNIDSRTLFFLSILTIFGDEYLTKIALPRIKVVFTGSR